MTGSWRYILHADLDAFYASVEQHDNPALRGRPVVVGGAPEMRGVVAAASYEARRFGVRSAMPMGAALRLCPGLVRVPPRFPRYRGVSRQVMDILAALTPLIEPLSLDEAYLDISAQVAPDGAGEAARGLKEEVRRQTGLAVTIGGGTNKTVAKIASQVAKPDGLLLVGPGEEVAFLDPLPVALLWGVGPKTMGLLRERGVTTIGALARADDQWLRETFGSRGLEMRRRAQARDDGPVTIHRETRSVSAETTLPQDAAEAAVLVKHLREMAGTVARHLQRERLRARTVRLKLRLADFTTFTRQASLSPPADDAETLFSTSCALLRREVTPGRRFRLVGIAATNLDHSYQLPLLSLDGAPIEGEGGPGRRTRA